MLKLMATRGLSAPASTVSALLPFPAPTTCASFKRSKQDCASPQPSVQGTPRTTWPLWPSTIRYPPPSVHSIPLSHRDGTSSLCHRKGPVRIRRHRNCLCLPVTSDLAILHPISGRDLYLSECPLLALGLLAKVILSLRCNKVGDGGHGLLRPYFSEMRGDRGSLRPIGNRLSLEICVGQALWIG